VTFRVTIAIAALIFAVSVSSSRSHHWHCASVTSIYAFLPSTESTCSTIIHDKLWLEEFWGVPSACYGDNPHAPFSCLNPDANPNLTLTLSDTVCSALTSCPRSRFWLTTSVLQPVIFPFLEECWIMRLLRFKDSNTTSCVLEIEYHESRKRRGLDKCD
jgi:hypothetical protein